MISVVVPSFNRKDFLREALGSVREQTLSPSEMIVVDDGSSDGTEAMCRAEFPNFAYIFQANKGVAAARNTGIRAASGEWIAFLDSDDLWLPHKLEEQQAYLQAHPEADILQSEEIWYRRGKRVNPGARHRKYGGRIFEKCIPLCIVSPSSVIIRKSVFEDVGVFDESFDTCEDYDLWLRISLHYTVHLLNKPGILKRNGEWEQLSSTPGQDKNRIRALLKILKDPKLSTKQRNLVVADIERRSQILIKGFFSKVL